MMAPYHSNFLTVKFLDKRDNFAWRCITVYDPNVRALKSAFWEELRSCSGDPRVPWVIGGNFNAIFSIEDKSSGAPNLRDIRVANKFLLDLHLCEPPAIGRRFSWTNGQENPIWVKLDRFLVNTPWNDHFPRILQNSLPRLGSDHVPIRLEVGGVSFHPRPFRFEAVWFTDEGFNDRVKQWREEMAPVGCGAFVLSKKLAGLRERLRTWAKFNFGSVKLKKLELLHQIETLDTVKESRGLLPSELVFEQSLLQLLEIIHKKEEIYLRQRSRTHWLKEGDGNTKFFHAVANGRKSRNLISGVVLDENRIFDPKEIGKIFVARFQQQFGSKRESRFKVDLPKLFENKQHVQLGVLEGPFSSEKIKDAVFSLGGDKAPGPDGFPMCFFKQCWESIKVDIFKFCEDFYFDRANLEKVNWASIALIPKMETLEQPGD
ncbi:uncharacterized protein LOC120249381 [Dioscorea cayenensis subsp. rotundata]|uniref:Uncharacterized protein LOC120249381 n=1 Tax=Dioscorea cayennensis subsp. rotundata TaxID=55577 RepID=A0AB40AHQ2_DIOCR|nr:uncharacterized protein LOC120249381 [Dioscorea cayenensis subsp. rotundata]